MNRLHHLLRLLPHVREEWQLALECFAWVLAVIWCVRTRTLMNRMGEIPDLTEIRWDLCPVRAPGLVVVVPAKDEAETVRPAMETLLAQDYPWLRVIAVNDRSTDATGAILDELAALHPERLAVLHLTETAEDWVAKTFAMEAAARQSRSDWLLFTDADVWFSPSLLRRALAYAEMSGADHLVVTPSAVIKSWGENVLLGFISVFALWLSRPWRVRDPRARWDFVGAGAFNLVRREAWEGLGGFAPQRLAVVEDFTLGRRVRAAGLRQRVVYAPGLVLVHWATGMRGLVRGMTKNLFSLVNFRLPFALLSAGFLLTVYLAPVAGLFWWRTLLPAVIALACVGVQYRVLSDVTGIEARWAWLYPLGTLAFLWAMLRSVVVTLWRRGVRWRDTFYPLRELRRHNSPLTWEWEASKARAEQRRTERVIRKRALRGQTEKGKSR